MEKGKEKSKDDKIEGTKAPKKAYKGKRIKALEGTESSIGHKDDLDFIKKYTIEPDVMGASAFIHDGINVSAERKFMDLIKTIPHTNEVIYDPKKKKPTRRSVQGKSGQK